MRAVCHGEAPAPAATKKHRHQNEDVNRRCDHASDDGGGDDFHMDDAFAHGFFDVFVLDRPTSGAKLH